MSHLFKSVNSAAESRIITTEKAVYRAVTESRRVTGGHELPGDKTFVSTKLCLSRQTFCRDKSFVATNILLSPQAYFCRDKRRVCLDKSMLVFVAIKVCLSRQ